MDKESVSANDPKIGRGVSLRRSLDAWLRQEAARLDRPASWIVQKALEQYRDRIEQSAGVGRSA